MSKAERAPCRFLLAAFALLLLCLCSGTAQNSPAASKTAAATASSSPSARPLTLDEARAELLAFKDRGAPFVSRLESFSKQLDPSSYLSLLCEFAPLATGGTASKALLVEAGDLALLLGSYSTAAQNFESAAFRLPPGRDDALLLKACRAYLVSGETDRASDRAELILRSDGSSVLMSGANLVLAWAKLISGRSEEAATASAAILKGSGALPAAAAKSAQRREALFIGWAAAPAAARSSFAAALSKEYPQSPEASLAAGALPAADGGAQFLPLPHWYLSGLISQQPAGAAAASASAAAVAAAPQTAASASGPSSAGNGAGSASAGAGNEASSPAATASSSPRYYQIGVFSKSENASALLTELGKKGFAAKIEKRQVKGRELLAVVVAAGSDAQATLLKLKDAGYEAYPLF